MDIKCRRTTCQHNKGQTCCANKVNINLHANCDTYEFSCKNVEDFSKDMFESAPEFANSRHIKDVKLKCGAEKCLFNKDGRCHANGITVIDNNEISACSTFIEDC
ncbi:MAG: DUF1540 domain-containing protein [Clostridia bacterium]|nr:DUF1540 domain-containing protein [Clostridia bacterium]